VNCIASSAPGRIRLRHAALRNPVRLARLAEAIGRWAHVHAISPNAPTGSLLVHYDALALEESECVRRCEDAVQALAPAASQAVAAPAGRTRHRGSPRVRANRVAKRGMLVSLATSLLLAALGAKRGHIGAGIVFLHALGVHLWVHRHHLLR
jgi:hypothetical protein